MEQLNFFPLSNPSNIYGLTRLEVDKNKILIATLEKQIFCIEYIDDKFVCNEVHFAYIPNGSDIISIDTFARSANNHDFVIGITFLKNSKDSDSSDFRKNVGFASSRSSSSSERTHTSNHYYFNIYSSLTSINRFDLNQIAQDCQTLELDFVPYHLYHTKFQCKSDSWEVIWLLSGGDCCVHIYREDAKKQCFYQEKIDLFPELTNFKSIILWIDVVNFKQEDRWNRLTAIGCEDGSVELSLVEYDDCSKPEILKSWKNQFDGPVLSVKFFQDQSKEVIDSIELNRKLTDENIELDRNIHLLVANSYETPVVFRNVQFEGMNRKKQLSGNDLIDILVATFIGDFNFDGYNEILLGTYSKSLLTYKYNSECEQYVIEEMMRCSNPILAIAYLDLTGNGVKELVVVTSKGVTIHQHKVEQIIKTMEKKLSKLKLEDDD